MKKRGNVQPGRHRRVEVQPAGKKIGHRVDAVRYDITQIKNTGENHRDRELRACRRTVGHPKQQNRHIEQE